MPWSSRRWADGAPRRNAPVWMRCTPPTMATRSTARSRSRNRATGLKSWKNAWAICRMQRAGNRVDAGCWSATAWVDPPACPVACPTARCPSGRCGAALLAVSTRSPSGAGERTRSATVSSAARPWTAATRSKSATAHGGGAAFSFGRSYTPSSRSGDRAG